MEQAFYRAVADAEGAHAYAPCAVVVMATIAEPEARLRALGRGAEQGADGNRRVFACFWRIRCRANDAWLQITAR